MNKLHLKYQQDTGNQVQRDINLIQTHSDFKHLYDYIKWLEEKINETDKETKHSNHYHDRSRNR